MNNTQATVELDLGITCVDADLKRSFEYDDNSHCQNVHSTIQNYIELLKKAIGVLELVKDTVTYEESKQIKLIGYSDSINIIGSPKIVERFVGFGIANYLDNDDTDSNDTDSNDTDSNVTDSNDTDSNGTDSNGTDSNDTDSNDTDSNGTDSNGTDSTDS